MSKLHNDDRFKHVNYQVTNLEKTFARIRKQQAEEKAARERDAKEVTAKVRTLKERTK